MLSVRDPTKRVNQFKLRRWDRVPKYPIQISWQQNDDQENHSITRSFLLPHLIPMGAPALPCLYDQEGNTQGVMLYQHGRASQRSVRFIQDAAAKKGAFAISDRTGFWKYVVRINSHLPAQLIIEKPL